MGFRKAEVTAGGVVLDEVDSRTDAEQDRPQLYFAGELLDLNGPVGGYNFQAASRPVRWQGRACRASLRVLVPAEHVLNADTERAT